MKSLGIAVILATLGDRLGDRAEREHRDHAQRLVHRSAGAAMAKVIGEKSKVRAVSRRRRCKA